MNVDTGIWEKLTRVVVFLVLVALLLAVGRLYLPLIQQNERMRKQVLSLETQIQRELETQKQLKTFIDAQRNDPKVIERLAREALHFAKSGETVIRFVEPKPEAGR